jgi:hypothetical protein
MIDPDYLYAFVQQHISRSHGKHYRLGFEYLSYVQFSRRRFKDPRAGYRYAERVVERWKRLYRAKVVYLTNE